MTWALFYRNIHDDIRKFLYLLKIEKMENVDPFIKDEICSVIKDSINELGLSEDEIMEIYRDKNLLEKEIKPLLLERAVLDKRYAFVADLGIITVQEDYVPEKCLSLFSEQNYEKFRLYDSEITDDNFSHPSHILVPGKTLWVRVYGQIILDRMTSEDHLEFLSKFKDVVYPGAQGASLVFDQKREKLPKGKCYCSFDKEENLRKNTDGSYSIPYVGSDSIGYQFHTVPFDNSFHRVYYLLVFTKVPDNYVEY